MWKASDVNINIVPGVSAVTSITSSPLRPSLLRSAAGALQSSAVPGPAPAWLQQLSTPASGRFWSQSGKWRRQPPRPTGHREHEGGIVNSMTRFVLAVWLRQLSVIPSERFCLTAGSDRCVARLPAPRVRSYLLAGQSGAELTKRYNKVSWRPSHPCCQT